MVLGTDLKIFVLVALTYYKHACLNLNNSTIWTLISYKFFINCTSYRRL